ncbi:CbtA family protein [Nocardioides immobilis]|uniref:CbtA family protein n=1 Tax=Nocardioides immobilis TaxID=2049295 RepID=UPI001FEC2565|nr:CbtA family protein [Nocardioides immobilis]
MSDTTSPSPALTPAAFLVRGLLVGLVAGFLAFLAGFAFGEPYVDDAIGLEEAAAAHLTEEEVAAEEAAAEEAGETTEVSRDAQKTWGLATGTLAVGTALGGFTALAAAACVGRLGSLSARGTTALVALLGFVAVSAVPFWKYPATPPAVGNPDSIGSRTTAYFALLLISVLAVIAAVVLANRLRARFDGFTSVVLAAAAYLVVVVAAGYLLPAVDELGAFPADTLWDFRRGSLLTLMTLWAAIGVGLTYAIGALHDRVTADAERKALAASL